MVEPVRYTLSEDKVLPSLKKYIVGILVDKFHDIEFLDYESVDNSARYYVIYTTLNKQILLRFGIEEVNNLYDLRTLKPINMDKLGNPVFFLEENLEIHKIEEDSLNLEDYFADMITM